MALFKRSYLTFIILTLLNEQERYGYEMCKIVQERTNGRRELKEGTLYPLLREMRKKGLIEKSKSIVESGPKRKYYRLTRRGKDILESEKKSLYDIVLFLNLEQ